MPYPPVDEMTNHPAREDDLPIPHPSPKDGERAGHPESATYSAEERRYLIEVARNAIASALAQREFHPEPLTPNLAAPRGVFVTLMLEGQLRGCVGQIVATNPLVEAVAQSAVSAAFCDPRFTPVTAAELPLLRIEISVLSPMHRITPEEVRVGVHGLLVCSGARRGLLLPQVATEFGWGVGIFLEQTCRKAGLPSDAWQLATTELYGFTAEKFGE